ncbi:Phosphatidylinositol 3-/4-kinase, catalytic domain-containing protein [Cynara cardunculus var. scolymus]|uniref:1-phosphatidylinositol 4-kinase n=1 Tax=Cynara cardunculus var. scolymus TaxID=59895 RepID=A0A103YGY9_CYNCS|nr:Phosphatidylinositol 3-/4-kinase, catalytic domain-containing protein [Cynara cardunculus var. scolymus]
MFMENCGSCEYMGLSAFPVEEVHKISVLDIRMANADKHAGNILVNKGQDGRFVPETVNYIKSLDAEEDIALRNFYGWNLPSGCARTFRVSTMLLKKGVEKGFTPFSIGNIMCRENLNKQSVIEEVVQEADDLVLPGSSEAAFIETVSQIMDRRLGLFA